MSFQIILEVILLGIALSMDAFAVSIVTSLNTTDLNKKRTFFTAGMFGFFQGFMPLISFLLLEIVDYAVHSSNSKQAIEIFSTIISWCAFAALLFLGVKMLIEAIKSLKAEGEELSHNQFSYGKIFKFAIATSIDALAAGIALHNEDANGVATSTMSTIFLHVGIIMVITFLLSLVGLFLGKKIIQLLKGRYEIASIIGGIILIALSIWVILSHYIGI